MGRVSPSKQNTYQPERKPAPVRQDPYAGMSTWEKRRAARTGVRSSQPAPAAPAPTPPSSSSGSVVRIGGQEYAADDPVLKTILERERTKYGPTKDIRGGGGIKTMDKDGTVTSRFGEPGGGGGGGGSETSAPTRDTAPPQGSPDAKASGTQTSPGGKALTLAEVEAWLGGKMANNFQGVGLPETPNGQRQLGVKSNGNMTTILPSDPIAAKAFGQDWVDANSQPGTDPANPQAGNSPGPDTVDQERAVSTGQEKPAGKPAVRGFNGAVFGGEDDEFSPGLAGTISSEERARRDAFLSDGDSMSALKNLDRHLGRTRLNGQTYSIGPEGKLIETTREEDWQLRHGGKGMSADREGFASLVRDRLAAADTPEDKAETLKDTYIQSSPGVKNGEALDIDGPVIDAPNLNQRTTITRDNPIASQAFGEDWANGGSVEGTPEGRGSVIQAPNMNQQTVIQPTDSIAKEAFGADWVGAAKKRSSFRDHNAAQNR